MDFRFSEKNNAVTINCSKILIKKVILHSGKFEDIVIEYSWEVIDSSDGQIKQMKHSVVLESFPNDKVINDEKHFIIYERWPNGWYNFRKNRDGVTISFQSKNERTKTSGLIFVLIFEAE